MAQIIESLFQKYGIREEAVRNREVSLATLRHIVISEGYTVDVFKAICRLRG